VKISISGTLFTGAAAGLFAQTLWTTDEGASLLVETVKPVNVARDADPNARADSTGTPDGATEPQLASGAEIDTVKFLVDVHRLRQASRPPRQIEQATRPAAPLHELNSFEGLKSAQQNACAHTGLFA
jgi:hypothetical protein